MTQSTYSAHALTRIAQRGVPIALLEMILEEHDRCVPAGGGCVCLSISKREADSLSGRYPSQLLDAATRHGVVQNRDGKIVTVLKLYDGKRGRRYRKRH